MAQYFEIAAVVAADRPVLVVKRPAVGQRVVAVQAEAAANSFCQIVGSNLSRCRSWVDTIRSSQVPLAPLDH